MTSETFAFYSELAPVTLRSNLFVRPKMKTIVFVLMTLFLGSDFALGAASVSEEIVFRFEPSFRDGIMVWLARTPGGKIHCSAYRLPLLAEGGVESHSSTPPKLLKEVVVSQADFDSLVSALESRELRDAAESDSIGLDGTGWIFRRKTGGRLVELRFWTPEQVPNSPALALGRRFAALAHVDDAISAEAHDSERSAKP